MNEKYDIIIIGSGLSGLLCGATLAKEGYSVCVLEKNPQTGGCFQGFKRFGRVLDTGIHYIGSLDKGEILHRCFSYIGIMNELNLIRLDEQNFDQVCFPDAVYPYAMGNEPFVETLSQLFPAERENLQRYMQNLVAVGDTVSPNVFRQGKISVTTLDLLKTSAWKSIASFTQNERLRQVLSNPALLYGGDKATSTFYIHGTIAASYLHGSYRFVGSSMQLTDALVRKIESHGGKIFTKTAATAIRCANNAVCAVETENGMHIAAKHVISTLHPLTTLRMTDKTTHIRKAYLNRLASLPNSYGFFTVYLIKKKNSTPYINRNLYLYADGCDAWHKTSFPAHTAPVSLMVSMQPSPENPFYTDVIELLSPMYINEVAQWTNTRYERRGEAYRDFKAKKKDEIIRFAKKYIPDIEKDTEHVFTTTPLSYRDYTGTPDGSAYGTMINCQNPIATMIPIRSKIKNLFFAGQNVNMHGVLGVTLTSMLACAEFVGEEYLAKKIEEA